MPLNLDDMLRNRLQQLCDNPPKYEHSHYGAYNMLLTSVFREPGFEVAPQAGIRRETEPATPPNPGHAPFINPDDDISMEEEVQDDEPDTSMDSYGAAVNGHVIGIPDFIVRKLVQDRWRIVLVVEIKTEDAGMNAALDQIEDYIDILETRAEGIHALAICAGSIIPVSYENGDMVYPLDDPTAQYLSQFDVVDAAFQNHLEVIHQAALAMV